MELITNILKTVLFLPIYTIFIPIVAIFVIIEIIEFGKISVHDYGFDPLYKNNWQEFEKLYIFGLWSWIVIILTFITFHLK